MTDPNRPRRIIQLAKKWQQGTITESEKNEFEDWYDSFENVFEMNAGETEEQAEERLYQTIISKGNISLRKSVSLWSSKFIGTAAAILLILGIGLYFYVLRQAQHDNSIMLSLSKHDIAPGTNRATLTLANGKVINLKNTKTGVVIDARKLTYNDGTEVRDSAIKGRHPELVSGSCTIQTPRGGTYQVILPDGTHIWLNAGSTLKFPATFVNLRERKVELTGEAYFVVKHNARQSFRVETQGQIVEDVGTEFNINAYADESSIKTTLLEGSVKVVSLSLSKGVLRQAQHDMGQAQHDKGQAQHDNSIVLTPGQQSTLHNERLQITQVDTEEATAWKNGYFKFNGDLKSIMNEVGRWYNVEVVYQMQPDPSLAFGAKISRSRSLSEVLKIIESAGEVHFKIEERRVTVMK